MHVVSVILQVISSRTKERDIPGWIYFYLTFFPAKLVFVYHHKPNKFSVCIALFLLRFAISVVWCSSCFHVAVLCNACFCYEIFGMDKCVLLFSWNYLYLCWCCITKMGRCSDLQKCWNSNTFIEFHDTSFIYWMSSWKLLLDHKTVVQNILELSKFEILILCSLSVYSVGVRVRMRSDLVLLVNFNLIWKTSLKMVSKSLRR